MRNARRLIFSLEVIDPGASQTLQIIDDGIMYFIISWLAALLSMYLRKSPELRFGVV